MGPDEIGQIRPIVDQNELYVLAAQALVNQQETHDNEVARLLPEKGLTTRRENRDLCGVLAGFGFIGVGFALRKKSK